MKCEICNQESEERLCPVCKRYLKWRYPKENPEDILDKYKELSDAHFYLKRRRRK